MLQLFLTRDSVAAADDVDAPHEMHLEVRDFSTALELVSEVLRQSYLPKISGGKATWVVSSGEPFAVCAEQWSAPRSIGLPKATDSLGRHGNVVRLHFSYIAQVEPDLVLDVLSRCTFNAASVLAPL